MKINKSKFALFSAVLILVPILAGAGSYGMNYSEPIDKEKFNQISDYETVEEDVLVELGASTATKTNEDGTLSYVYSVSSIKNEDDETIRVNDSIVLTYDESLSEEPKSIPKTGTLVLEKARISFGRHITNLVDCTLKEFNTLETITVPISLKLEDNEWEGTNPYNLENGTFFDEDSIDEQYEQYLTMYDIVEHSSRKKMISTVLLSEIVILAVLCVVTLMYRKRKE